MDKYIIINTFCDKEEIANKIINNLLEKRLVAGSQISKVYSKYHWNNIFENGKDITFHIQDAIYKSKSK